MKEKKKCSECGCELRIIRYTEMTGEKLPVFEHIDKEQGRNCELKSFKKSREEQSDKFWNKILNKEVLRE